jgi:hypothetical protein
LKPYAKPAVQSVSVQEYCAHCIDAAPVGIFQVEGKAFALCGGCANHLKAKKELPPIAPSAMSMSLINEATYLPGLDELERLGSHKQASRNSHIRHYYVN